MLLKNIDKLLQKLYGDDSCPSQLQSLAEDLQLAGVEGQMDGKLCSSVEGGTDGKDLPVCTCVCGSTHDCGCVVDGSFLSITTSGMLNYWQAGVCMQN